MDPAIEPMRDYRDTAIAFATDAFWLDAVDRGAGWWLPVTSSGRQAALFLIEEGKFEKHERMEWYRPKL